MDTSNQNLGLLYEKDTEGGRLYVSQKGKSNDKLKTCLYILATIICLASCIVAVVSAIYCYQALIKIERVKMDIVNSKDAETAEHEIVAEKLVAGKETYEREEDLDYYGSEFDNFNEESYESEVDDDDDDDNDDEEDDDDDVDYESEELISVDDDLDDYTDNGLLDISGSGEGMPENSLHSRERRSRSKPANKDKNKKKGGQKGKLVIPAAIFQGVLTDAEVEKMLPQKVFDTYVNSDCLCEHIEELKGVLCRNKTFIPDNKAAAIRMFKDDKDHSIMSKPSPVTLEDNSIFRAGKRSKGLHLVFAQVAFQLLFSGNDQHKTATIVQKSSKGAEKQKYTCATGVYLHETFNKEQMQTCTIIGIVDLQKSDTLEIQNNDRMTKIDMAKGTTRFGIVKLGGR